MHVKRQKNTSNERGAALILTVIVIMVLTTLGMAMVAFTTTEERTAVSYRDTLQARAVAEAGVRVVQEMFRDPTDRALVPLYSATTADCTAGTADYCGTTEATIETSMNARGIWRKARAGASPARYTGNNNKLFTGPFTTSWAQTFGGTYSATSSSDVYDLKFNCTNPTSGAAVPSANCWLDAQINAMFDNSGAWNTQPGRITDISFYRPPMIESTDRAYGICIVRVTAQKTDSAGNLLARDTVEAVIGDNNLSPAILGDGAVDLGNTQGCGDGCEQIHANGNLTVGTVDGGDPSLSAIGSISGTGTNSTPGTSPVTAPAINPWDTVYKPTSSADLGKYYLVTARRLQSVWRDDDASNNPSARTCGYSTCQDYNLEYTTSDAVQTGVNARGNAAARAYMYKWDSTNNEWDECSGPAASGGTISCNGLSFVVTLAADNAVSGTGDSAVLPFNKAAVPQTVFDIQSALSGATVLVDGKFKKHGSLDTTMTVIAAGSIVFESQTSWRPAMSNKVMLIAGRDIDMSASWNNEFHNTCNGTGFSPSSATLASLTAASGIMAAHEQILGGAQTSMIGIILAENEVNFDPQVNISTAIDVADGDHVYLCDTPEYPWVRATKPTVLSLKSVPD
ncbi:MAG TPA: PilX N-terminal domain-containing pilus assembly protein [Thermoanaerobaculia bacterium]|jgi:Tfp pilus assembly protein PilX